MDARSGPRASLSIRRASARPGARSLLLFRLVPIPIELFERQLARPFVRRRRPAAVSLFHTRLDVFEAPLELGNRATKGALGIDVDVAREVDEREQHIAELTLDSSLVPLGDRPVELAQLLGHLRAGTARIGPIE